MKLQDTEVHRLIVKYAKDYRYIQLRDEEFREVLRAYTEELLELKEKHE